MNLGVNSYSIRHYRTLLGTERFNALDVDKLIVGITLNDNNFYAWPEKLLQREGPHLQPGSELAVWFESRWSVQMLQSLRRRVAQLFVSRGNPGKHSKAWIRSVVSDWSNEEMVKGFFLNCRRSFRTRSLLEFRSCFSYFLRSMRFWIVYDSQNPDSSCAGR